MWVLGGESDGGEHIHDKVDPKELDDREGAESDGHDSEHNEHDAGEVHGHLVLNEFAGVVLNVSSPSDGVDHRDEVVVVHDQRRSTNR